MPYIAIVFAIWLQTDTTVQGRTSLQRGYSEYASGHFGAAERLLAEALGQIPQDNAALRAKVLGDLGNVYTEQEEFSTAERAYSQSLSILQKLSDSNNSALMLQNLGVLYSLQGRNDEALQAVVQALKLLQSAMPADPAIHAQVLVGLGIVQYRRNNTRQAEKTFNEALGISRTLKVPFDATALLNNLGALYLRQHKFKQAQVVLKRALQIKEAGKGVSDPALTPELNALAATYMATGKFTEAEEQCERSLKILESRRPDFAPAIARVLHYLSYVYVKLGRNTDSEMALGEAAKIAHDHLSKDSEMAQIVEDYSNLLQRRGQKQEAANLRAQVKHARAIADLVVRTHP